MTAFTAKGIDGQLEFDGETLTFHRKGLAARMSSGGASHSRQIADVLRIDLKEATRLVSGAIRFAVPGETGDKITNDRNGMMFSKRQWEQIEPIYHAAQAILAARGELSSDRVAEIAAVNEAATSVRLEEIMSKVSIYATYEGHVVDQDGYRYLLGAKRPVEGATAEYESGADSSRPTLTRIGAGALIAGPVGAIAGGMFKKDRTKGYVTILFPDQASVIIEGPAKDEKKMRAFAEQFNAISRKVTPLASGREDLGSYADQLLKLKELRDAGVLTDEQYEQKSAPLIDQL